MDGCFTETERSAVRDHLGRILASEPFLKSGRRRRFLEYIVNEALAGRSASLKGYNVAVEVFDRPSTFDPATDPIVRIEAARLRERLRDYYETAGGAGAVRIDLPKGGLAPRIEIGGAPDLGGGPVAGGDAALRAGRQALAVLPFVNLSGDERNDYLGDGFADALVTDLAKVAGLFVVSRHSSFLYRGASLSIGRIAEALRVRFVVEGSVQAAQQRLRVSANVLDATSEQSVWSARFEGGVTEIFSIQDDISRGVARALSVKLTPQEDGLLGRRGTRDPKAHDELLKGLSLFWGYSQPTCAAAQGHLLESARLDPAYAAPHAWLARTYVLQHCMSWDKDGRPPLEPALEHARLGAALDPRSAMAQAVLGWTLLFFKDGESALKAAEQACALDPHFPDGRMFQALIEASTGRADAAHRSIEASMLFQPLPSSFCFYALGMCRFAAEDFVGATDALLKAVEINPAFLPAHYGLAIAYGLCGRLDEAKAEADIVRLKAPDISKEFFLQPRLAAFYRAGRRAAGLP